MRYQKKWINRFMIYQKIFVDILLLFNGMILNYLYFHFYDSRYILRLSKFQKMLTVCLLALMFVFVYSDFGYCSYIFTSLLGFLFIRIFYHFEACRPPFRYLSKGDDDKAEHQDERK